jgi:hypothetical protein
MGCLKAFPQEILSGEKTEIILTTKDCISCCMYLCQGFYFSANSPVFITFAFSNGEGNVGEPLRSQIAVTSTARQGSAPVNMSTLKFKFTGCLSEIQLSHKQDEVASGNVSTILDCVLEESSSPTRTEQKPRWTGSSDLTIHPGQTKVYSFSIIFREAGDVDALASTFEISTDQFDLVCSNPGLEDDSRPSWWIKTGSKLKSRRLGRASGATVKVLPKPPKMEIRLPNLRDHYYTDEPINLDIEVLNKEEEDAEASIEVRLLGRSMDTLAYTWVGREASSPMKELPPQLDGPADVDLPGHVVGRMTQGSTTTETIQFKAPTDPSDYALEVKVLYHLISEPDIPVSKTMIADLVFNGPFETSYDLTPRVHSDPWPSYFVLQDEETKGLGTATAFGLSQQWHLRAKVASFAEDVLVIKDMALETHAIHGGATCEVAKEFEQADVLMNPEEINERSFCINSTKIDLEERRATALDMSLNITWQRSSSQDTSYVITSLPIPRIHIPSSEPRVLATALRSAIVASLIHMDYTLENPTMHFLTFELSMEASEEFGFSGPKLRVLHLLPMSRQTARFNILPMVTGQWITPQMKVVDRYFNKTLKVLATDGLRLDKKGVSVWVHGEGGDGPRDRVEDLES